MDLNYRQSKTIEAPEAINISVNKTPDVTEQEQDMPPQTLEAFLADIEKRAYHMAAFATGSHADALDLLQDSMIKLVTNYADNPPEQWKPLFYKILQNRIRDYHRHQKVKNLLFFWKSANQDDDNPEWPPADAGAELSDTPERDIARTQQQSSAIGHLQQLSDKQQQSFLLRSWEGLSTAETAEIMGCSQGSVKTHYSRAVTKLKTLMEEEHDITF